MSHTKKATEFNPEDLVIIKGLKYRGVQHTFKGREMLLRFPHVDGKSWKTEITHLKVSKACMQKWSNRSAQAVVDLPCNVLTYKGIVVAMELTHLQTLLDGTILHPVLEQNVNMLKEHIASDSMSKHSIQADLNGVYWAAEGMPETFLTRDHTLTSVPMSCIFFKDFHLTAITALTPRLKYAIKYTLPTNKDVFSITTPIFSNTIGASTMKKSKRTAADEQLDDLDLEAAVSDTRDLYIIDELSKSRRVSLKFMINKYNQLEKFVDHTELDSMFKIFEVMIALNTLSLPSLPDPIKEKYPLEMSAKDMIIWILGLQYRFANESVENLEIIRSTIRFLFQCLVKDGHSNPANLYNEGFTADDVTFK